MRAPYRLDLTANALRRLSSNVVDVYEGGAYRRLAGDGAAPQLIEVRQTQEDELTVRLHGAGAVDGAALVRRMLGTDVDLDHFYTAAVEIPWLFALVERARGVKPPRYPSLWETVVNSVVYQQISIHAAAAILRRVIERYAAVRIVSGVRLAPFPTPQVIADAQPGDLRTLGLSANKIVALRTLARAILEGELDEDALERLPTPELVAGLERAKGVGPWTAAVIALRGFGRLDIFPMKDSGVARTLKDLSGDPDVDAARILALLGPQRGMLYYHLLLGRLAARGEVTL
ncbi:MAG: DNA-3-methyladenine glycosylase [Candidatus Velthaea sp.]